METTNDSETLAVSRVETQSSSQDTRRTGNVRLATGCVPDVPGPIAHGPHGCRLESYRQRAALLADHDVAIDGQAAADDLKMWWEEPVKSSIGLSQRTVNVDVGALTETALASSPLVRSILSEPRIRACDLVVADAEFDSTFFLEGKFTDTNEPVGNVLTTGDNSDRFRDETFTASGGIRKKTRYGASMELFQRTGFQENNSQFLDPNPQGTTRLEFNFTQPLMRDRGKAVNTIRVLLAQLDYQIANASVRSNLEDHLIEVAQAYWDLYLARADWLQRKRLYDGAERLHKILQARTEVDSQKRQLLRAQAAIASRQSALVRATTRIRDIQSQLRLLTGSPQFARGPDMELIPFEPPITKAIAVSAKQSVVTALDNRSDVAQSIRNVQAVSARVGAAKNQVLPRLDLILGAYTAGLDDKRNVFGAWSNQFNDGRPTYWAGLAYEIPIRNRASKARLTRNRWELSRAISDFQQTTEVAFTEVEVAVRETRTAYNEMLAKRKAIAAASNEVEYLQQRWELLPDPNESAVLLIEDLLDAQERLANEERSFATSQVAYALSWLQLRKVMGTLLRFDPCNQTPHVQQRTVAPAAPKKVLANEPSTEEAQMRLVSPQSRTAKLPLGTRHR